MPELAKMDSATFAEISDRAKEAINEYYSEWTDRNAHDPGVTLIELFSWLSEMQRYFIENSAEAQLLFDLFNVRRFHACPAEAHTELSIEAAETALTIPAGTPVYAENIRFEMLESKTLFDKEKVTLKTDPDIFNSIGTKLFVPFGEKPEVGKSFQILLKSPPPADGIVLSVEVAESFRNKMNLDNCIFLSDLCWECLTESGFVKVPVFDATCGLLMSGDITLLPRDDMTKDKAGNYVISCRLMSNEYDITPALISLKTNIARFQQTYSLCETQRLTPSEGVYKAGSYLAINGDNLLFIKKDGSYVRVQDYEKIIDTKRGEAKFVPEDGAKEAALLVSCEREYLHHRVLGYTWGFPNQKFKVELHGRFIVYDSFKLIVSSDSGLEDAVLWEQTDSLHRSGPHDYHYELDEQTGEVVFGDGFHGRMPAGIVIIASLAVTEGVRGNIKAGGLKSFEWAGVKVQAIQNEHAEGGRDRESAEAALKRTKKENIRAVTARDYETIVKSTPGLMIERVSAFIPDGADDASFPVTIAVKPYGERSELTQAYKNGILEWLEPHRLAGTSISVVPPEYVSVRLTAELSGREYWGNAKPNIEKKLRSYFNERFGHFGANIRFGEVLAFLDSLPEVTRALSLYMRSDGSGAAEDDAGNIILERQCIAYLGQVDIFVY